MAMQTATAVLPPQANFLGRTWNEITRPHPSLTDIETIRQSRLLAGLTIILMLVVTIALCILLVVAPSTQIKSSLMGIMLTLVIYFINRSGRFRLSAYLFVGLNILLMEVQPLVDHDLTWLFFTTMTLIISAILMKPKFTITLFFASIVYQILLVKIQPMSVNLTNYAALIIFMVTSSLLIVFINHRNGLERERRAELQKANDALRESEASLEKRVARRTRDLELASEVAKQAASALDLNVLLPDIVERTRSAFDLYHVSVFLHNADEHKLTYQAGTGEAGQKMKASGKYFDTAETKGLVPHAALLRQPIMVNNVEESADHLKNPLLPNTQSELVLPMVVGTTLIGVLDLQASQVSRFGDDDVRVFTSLADQMAVAVQNATLYAEQVKVAEELRALDNLKGQFLASMSHELRTPLNAILNFTEFVAQGMLGSVNDKQKDALAKSLDSGKHLLSLINDVLDMSKIESGMMKLFVEDNINLNDEMRSVIATAQTLLKDKPVQLIEDIDHDLPVIVGDRRRVRQILL
ncbi:MAG: histidine kinase dimerization/phospho-acceptor domain-containing protein, partial [Chloroflexota bacterium]